MAQTCECAANWRIELTNLRTGRITHTITPVSFEFETSYMEAGRGTITFNRRGNSSDVGSGYVSVSDSMPYTTGIFFSRIAGGSASPNSPVNMFGGFIETYNGNSDGTVTLGFAEMQRYLDFRMIRSDLVFTGLSQNFLARDLVMYARGENINGGSVDPAPAYGIPLIGGVGVSAFNRDRTYLAKDRPVIGDMLKQLIEVINGPVYQMFHYRNPIPGLTEGWYSEMGFFDSLTQPSPAKYVRWDHLTDFTLNLDGNELANQVDAFGDPQDDGTPRIATANSPSSFEPRYDAAPAFQGVTNLITLGQHAAGYQQDHQWAALNLQLNFTGLDYGTVPGPYSDHTLNIDDFVPGFDLNIDIDSPHYRIDGGPEMPGTHVPTIGRVSVGVGQEGSEKVTVQIILNDFPGNMVSSPPRDCVDCT